MRKHQSVLVVILLFIISNGFMFLPPAGFSPLETAKAASPPSIEDAITYWGGHWIVDSNLTYRNQTIIVDGNITVPEGYTLTLINVTIKMNGTGNLSRNIQVNNTASLIIRDYDSDPLTIGDGCHITSNHTDGQHRFGFSVNAGANFSMVNSKLSECGESGGSLSKRGLYIRTDNAVVRNCSISKCYSGVIIYDSVGIIIDNNAIFDIIGVGIHISTADDSYIHNNTIKTANSNSYGVYISSGERNRIICNTINCTGSLSSCISLSSFSSRTEIISNTLNCTASNSRGIYCQSNNVNISSNTIFAWDSVSCIDLSSVSWINLTNNILKGNDTFSPLKIENTQNVRVIGGSIWGRSTRIYVDNCQNITFDTVDFISKGIIEGIAFFDVKNVLIVNSTFSSDDEDIYLYTGAEVTVRNSVWTTTGFYNDLCNLTEQYYLSMTVVDLHGTPVPGANVQIKNLTGEIVFDNSTDANGQINYIPLTEAVHNKTGSIQHTPHNITVTAPGFQSWYSDPIMNRTKSIYAMLLQPGEKPIIHYSSDWNVSGIEEYWNQTFLMDGNITVYNGETLILHNCTVIMNCSKFDGQYHIQVLNGGTLRILDYDWNNSTKSDESLITDSPYDIDNGSLLDFAYNLYIDWGGHLEILNSSINDCGWLPDPAQPWFQPWEQGVWIDADDAMLDHVDITSRYKGIIISWTSDVTVSNCTININASETEAIGIFTYDSFRTRLLNNSINMAGSGDNQIGIILSNNIDSIIFGNYVNMQSTTGWGDGINIANGGSGNQVIANTVDQNIDGAGIVLWGTGDVNVEFNNVRTYASYSSAILLAGGWVTNSNIENNNLILSDLATGINIQDDCQNTVVNNNVILGAGNYIDAISIDRAYNNFTISNNMVTLTGMYSNGLSCDQSSYFDVYGLNVTISDLFSTGILLRYCDNVSMVGVNVSSSSGADDSFGAWVEHSEYIIIIDFTANLQNDYGTGMWFHDGSSNCFVLQANISTSGIANEALVGFNCSSVVVINSTLSASLQDDIVLAQGATVAMINTTFSDRTVVDPLSTLYVFWYLNVKVINDLGQPFNGVNVRVQRADATVINNGVTDNNGWVKWILCMGYVNTSTGIDNSSNPYTIRAYNTTCWDETNADISWNGRTVVIKLSNEDPLITNPLGNIIIREDTVGNYDFNATDHENNPIVWTIDTTSSWVSLNSSTGKLTLAPNETHVGSHVFTLRATDFNSGYDEFVISISVTNRAPVIQTANVLSATEDSLYSVNYTSDDDPGTTWTLVNGPSWLNMEPNTGVLSGTPNNNHVGSWGVDISVADGHGGVTWNNFTLTVDNNPPTILTNFVQSATEDYLYSVDYASSDDGQGTITWSLITGPSWLSIDPTTGVLSGTPTNIHVDRRTVTIEVSDGNSGTTQQTFALTVINTPPTISTADDPWADEDMYYEVDYSSSDDGQGTVAWSLSTNAGGWLTIVSSTGILSGTPRNVHVGSYWVKVTVDDGNGGVLATNFTLTVNNTNDAPKISTKDMLDATEDQLYFIKYKASDEDGDSVSWSVITNADWLSMESTSGELSGTPINLDVGIWEVTVSCFDGNDGYASHTFNVTVINVNDAPVINFYSPPETYPTMEEGIALDFSINFSDEDSNRFTIKWTLDGLNVRSDVPFWKYIPDFGTAGDHDVIVNITDDGSASVSHRWIVIVSSANRAPIINRFIPTNLKPILDPGTSTMAFSVNASDPDSDQLTYEWFINGEDTGERTNSFILYRLRLSDGPGIYNLAVSVTDSEGAVAVQNWTVDVKPESSKKEESGSIIPYIILLLVIVVLVIIVIFFMLKKKRPISEIEDIFIISNNGILLAHKSKELRPDIDDTILSGMLTAIQDFIKDAFKDKTKFGLKRLDFGDSEIRLQRGKGFFVAMVFSGVEPPNLEDKLEKTIAQIESKYGEILENWNGNLNRVRGIKDHLDGLLK